MDKYIKSWFVQIKVASTATSIKRDSKFPNSRPAASKHQQDAQSWFSKIVFRKKHWGARWISLPLWKHKRKFSTDGGVDKPRGLKPLTNPSTNHQFGRNIKICQPLWKSMYDLNPLKDYQGSTRVCGSGGSIFQHVDRAAEIARECEWENGRTKALISDPQIGNFSAEKAARRHGSSPSSLPLLLKGLGLELKPRFTVSSEKMFSEVDNTDVSTPRRGCLSK